MTIVWGADFVLVKNLLGSCRRCRSCSGAAPLRSSSARSSSRAAPDSEARRRRVLSRLPALPRLALQILGQAETTASNAAFLTGMASVLTPVAAYLLTRKLPTLENGLGITLAGAGFVLMTLPPRHA